MTHPKRDHGSRAAPRRPSRSVAAPSCAVLAAAMIAVWPCTPAHAEAAPDSTAGAGLAAPVSVTATPPVRRSANAGLPTAAKVRLSRQDHNVMRAGPGERFAMVGVFPKGATFPIVTKSGDWYNVRLSDTETGWIHSSLCEEFQDFDDLEFRPNPKLYSRMGSFMLTAYTGAYAFDHKSNSLVIGGRLGYYVFDFVQVEGGLAWTHVSRPREIVESLFGLSLEEEDFHMLFYHLNANVELLPGRQMVPYLTIGVGSSIMEGDSEKSFNIGAGTALYLSKRLATRWEFRDYKFSTGPEGARQSNDNIEFTLGAQVLF